VGSSHGCNTSGPSGGEPSQFNDPDRDDDEYVSFNDEGMYNSDGDDGLDQNHNAKSVALVNSDLMMTDSVHEEPTMDDTVHIEPLFTHDLENPRIEVGASFSDFNTFRRALRYFAIKNKFDVATIKSVKKRFIGKCKDPSCIWRIHASILQNNKTFMVCMYYLCTYICSYYLVTYANTTVIISGEGITT
jgi:MuDR family transposase